MPVSKSQQKAVHKYVKANYDRMELTVPKGQKGTIKTHAAARGESVNGFIGRAISETMERDGGGMPLQPILRGVKAAQGGEAVLPSKTIEAAQRAAEAAGETLPDFVARAVETQAKRDSVSRQMKGGKPNE